MTAVFSIDTNYCYKSFNKSHAALMKSKYNADIELGKNMLDYISVDIDREKVKQDLDIPLKQERSTASSSCGEKDLSDSDLETQCDDTRYYDIRGADNKFIGFGAVEKHVTDCKQDEELTGEQVQLRTILTESEQEDKLATGQVQLKTILTESKQEEELATGQVQLKTALAGCEQEEEPAGEDEVHATSPGEHQSSNETSIVSQQIHRELAKTEISNRLVSMLKTIKDVNKFILHETDRQRLIQRCCDTLVEARGYDKAWILLIDKNRSLVSAASTDPEGKPAVLRELKGGNNSLCVKQVLERQQVFVVYNDVKSQCRDCRLANTHCQSSALISRLEYEGIIYGIIVVNMSPELASDIAEHDLFRELAGNIAFALANIDRAERLKESTSEYRQLTESVCDMFFALDSELRCTYWNKASEELTGILAEDAFGKNLTDIFPDVDSSGQVQAICRRVIGTGQPQYFKIDYPGGKNVIYELSVYPKERGVTVSIVTQIVKGGIFRGIRG